MLSPLLCEQLQATSTPKANYNDFNGNKTPMDVMLGIAWPVESWVLGTALLQDS